VFLDPRPYGGILGPLLVLLPTDGDRYCKSYTTIEDLQKSHGQDNHGNEGYRCP